MPTTTAATRPSFSGRAAPRTATTPAVAAPTSAGRLAIIGSVIAMRARIDANSSPHAPGIWAARKMPSTDIACHAIQLPAAMPRKNHTCSGEPRSSSGALTKRERNSAKPMSVVT